MRGVLAIAAAVELLLLRQVHRIIARSRGEGDFEVVKVKGTRESAEREEALDAGTDAKKWRWGHQ
jgi:hypothetical protein